MPAGRPGVRLVLVTGQLMLVMPGWPRSWSVPAAPGRGRRGQHRTGWDVTVHQGLCAGGCGGVPGVRPQAVARPYSWARGDTPSGQDRNPNSLAGGDTSV